VKSPQQVEAANATPDAASAPVAKASLASLDFMVDS
jgi:hypothetical protein